jgi:hypothetical protein
MLGSVVAAACLQWGWGWAFLSLGGALAGMGIIIWLFLVVEPEEAGLFKMRDSIVVGLGLTRAVTNVIIAVNTDLTSEFGHLHFCALLCMALNSRPHHEAYCGVSFLG